MRATALLLVLALLPGCLTGTGQPLPEPVPALDMMAQDISPLGQERVRRLAAKESQPEPVAQQPAPPPAAKKTRDNGPSFLGELLDEALVDDGAYFGELLDTRGP
jgi:hypothetical protein